MGDQQRQAFTGVSDWDMQLRPDSRWDRFKALLRRLFKRRP